MTDRFPSRALTIAQAGPAPSYVRNPFGGHPASGLTPARLGAILRASIVSDPREYLELAEDLEERFPQYSATLGIRKRQVARLPLQVVAAGEDEADKDEAAFVERVLQSPHFALSKIDQLDAIGKGFSCVEMNWQVVDGQWLPVRFDYRDPRFFAFRQDEPDRIAVRVGSQLEELVPHKWLVHRAKAKSGLTIRGGLARQVAWIWMFQAFNTKDWAVFAEAFGMPYRLGRYDAGASDGDKRALLQALMSMGTDGAGIIPKESMIELIEATVSGSTDLYERRAVYLDRQVSKIVLGQTGTTDEMSGGYALGKVHNEVREDIRNADAEQWAATLNEQLVVPLIAFNFAARDRVTLPIIRVVHQHADDIRAWVDNVEALVPLGLKVSIAEAQRRLNVRPPKEGEAVLRVASLPRK